MNGNGMLSKMAWDCSASKRWIAASFMLAVFCGMGCADHRISLQQFMAIQEKGSAATTQPAQEPTLTDEERTVLDRELGSYRLGPGDELNVTVSAPEAETAPTALVVHVNKNGEIRLPKVGVIKLGGLDLEDAESQVLDALIQKQIYDDKDKVVVHIGVASPDTTNVLVVGAAGAPGLVRLRRTERNLLNAVVAAGGMAQSSSGEVTLKRLRKPEESVTLNLQDPRQLRASLALGPLENGDILQVHAAKPNTVFVGGLVNAPGPQPYPAGTDVTVLQAIAAASGLRTDLTPREATLLRRINGQDYHVKLNLDRITTAKDPNITLAAGDVLWVPFTAETRVQDWINKNIFVRIGANATYGANYNMTGEDYLNNAARQRAQLYSNRGSGGSLQDTIDPFGFLQRTQTLNALQGR